MFGVGVREGRHLGGESKQKRRRQLIGRRALAAAHATAQTLERLHIEYWNGLSHAQDEMTRAYLLTACTEEFGTNTDMFDLIL